MSNPASLNLNRTHFISLQQGVDMTTLYRQHQENILLPEFRNRSILPVCETFSRAAIDYLLAEEGCAGIRIYYGMDAELRRRW